MNKTVNTLLTFLTFSALLFGQETIAEGWTKSFAQTTHPGSPYDVVVTQAVTAGWDIDQDGMMEFLVVSDHSNPNGGGEEHPTGASLWLYEADGAGSFTLAWSWWDTTLYTGGASFPTHSVGDLDGDGNQEVLLGMPYGTGNPPDGSNPARFYVFEGPDLPSTPTATWDFDVSIGTNTRPSCIAVDDIDGDGSEEVAVGFRAFSDAAANDAMMIFSLNGSFAGTFTQWTIEVIDTTSDVGSLYAAEVGDVDNDGNKEAFFGSDYGMFYEATGTDTYAAWDQFQFQGPYYFWALQGTGSFDIDGNGSEELVVSPWTGDVLLLSEIADLHNADSTDVNKLTTIDGGTRGLAVGDFDGDGLGEIFIGNNYNSSVWRMDYQSGSVTDSASWSVPEMVYQADTSGSVRTYSLAFGGAGLNGGSNADLTGNNYPELVIGYEDGDSTATEYVVVLTSDETLAIGNNFGAHILDSYSLKQNYPNPFNPVTSITYELSAAGDVTLHVYDLTGRLVRELVSEHMSAGPHSTKWDGTDMNGKHVASGTYLYTLQVNGAKISRTMTLLK